MFCDIEEEQYTLDPEKLETLITDKTVAILPVHVYGHICRWQAIREIADRHGLKVIYDAGPRLRHQRKRRQRRSHGRRVHVQLPRHQGVPHGGGRLPYLRRWIAEAVFHGVGAVRYGHDGEQSEMLGTNAKMTEFSAAMGLCNLRHLDEQIACRRQAAERYRQRLSGRDGVVLSPEQAGVVSNYAYMPVRFLPEQLGYGRDAVLTALAERRSSPGSISIR